MWTIFLTILALSREHDILNTVGPGQGIIDNRNRAITWKTNNELLKWKTINELFQQCSYRDNNL